MKKMRLEASSHYWNLLQADTHIKERMFITYASTCVRACACVCVCGQEPTCDFPPGVQFSLRRPSRPEALLTHTTPGLPRNRFARAITIWAGRGEGGARGGLRGMMPGLPNIPRSYPDIVAVETAILLAASACCWPGLPGACNGKIPNSDLKKEKCSILLSKPF